MDIQEIKKRNSLINEELNNLMSKIGFVSSDNGIYHIKTNVKKVTDDMDSMFVGDYINEYGYEDFSDYITCLYEDELWTQIEHRLSRILKKKYDLVIDPYKLHDEFVFERVKVDEPSLDELKERFSKYEIQ